nr:hypothetical protein [uncultured Duncaniella sp.]
MQTYNRQIIIWLSITIVVMFVLPFVVARLASECSGMALCMMLFFIINPIYSIILGFNCGKNIRQMWNLPLVSSIAFLAGTWLFFDIKEVWFLVYAAVYLVIGLTAMGISRYIKKANKSFPFSDAPNTAVITCAHIVDDKEPILFVSHDIEDGMWQFLCGREHSDNEAKIVSLKYVFELDPTIGLLKDLPCGYCAERESLNDKWKIYRQ